MKRYTTQTRRICAFAAAVLLLGALLSLASCSRPPKADEIRADVIALVEASYELNEVFLGAGLPVLDRSNEEYAYTYSAAPATVNTYDIIDVDRSPFRSIEEIKAAAERVYSPDLLETNLYVNAFVGQAITDLGAKVTVVDARYTEDAD